MQDCLIGKLPVIHIQSHESMKHSNRNSYAFLLFHLSNSKHIN